MLVPCLKVTLCFLVAFAITKCVSDNCERCGGTKHTSIRDVPLKKDLRTYLDAAWRIIDFCNEQKIDLDINFSFGMFLLQVNLKSSLQSRNLPTAIRKDIYDILEQNNKHLQSFRNKVDNADVRATSLRIRSLFLKEMPWVARLIKFEPVRSELPLFRAESHSGNTDPDWMDYVNKIPNYEKWIPNPPLSDYCIASLAHKSVIASVLTCNIPEICHHMLKNGTNFGYALTHRLLLMIQAYFRHGCSVYSYADDRRIRNEYCAYAHEEAHYIAAHNYNYLDLLLEQISLCSLDGLSEFIHRSWLTRVLLHQTSSGCFGEHLPTLLRTERSEPRERLVINIDHELLNGTCNAHLTGVAAATIGAAVRFVIEMYY